AVGLEPDPDALAELKLVESAPPTGDLDLGVWRQRPDLRQALTLDQQRDALPGQIDSLERGEPLGDAAQKLGAAGDLLHLVVERLGRRIGGVRGGLQHEDTKCMTARHGWGP